MLKNNKFIDSVLIFEKDEWRNAAKSSKKEFFKKAVSFFREIRKAKFDAVFDLSMNSQYGFFLKLTGIKMRVGYNFKKRGRFLTHRIDVPAGYADKPVACYYLELLKFLDITPKDYNFDLFLGEDNLKRSRELLRSSGLGEDAVVVGVCPGSGDSWQQTAYFKRWPEENFLKLCEKLTQEGAEIILFGSPAESELCGNIAGIMKRKPVNLCGKINLEEFYGLMNFCKVVITNDGGPFHIAQALNKNTVVFFGPVDDKVYGVYPHGCANRVVLKREMSCRPCYKVFKFGGCSLDKQCLRDIGVEEAFQAVKKLL